MAQREIIELVDDLDGEAADETVSFGLDGHAYEIDLSAKNARKLRQAMARYESVARRVSSRRAAPAARTRSGIPAEPSGRSGDANVIREWARTNGYDVNARGRIPAHLSQAYQSR
jgi:hypothetical protein